MAKRIGEQTPTYRICCNYTETRGERALREYRETGREPEPWQETLINDIMAVDDDGLYVHVKVGYSIPRRNGKGEVLTMRELDALENGERVLHTAHRTSTSSAASLRLAKLLRDKGYTEVIRVKKDETYERAYTYSKQFGLERITILDTGASVDFRTRTSKGGLGEGFDVLIVDEAQEYTEDQRNTLQYIVSDSPNPQTILCGTPPTSVSSGTVFPAMRNECIQGESESTYWAEWSVEQMCDVNNVDLWYRTNPAMGFQLDERKIRAEDKSNEVDYNIQRFGLWLQYNQKSAISENEWNDLKCAKVPERVSDKIIGIKYGRDGMRVAMSIAYKTSDGKIFLECIGCKNVRTGNGWIVDFLKKAKDIGAVIVDGASGSSVLTNEMHDAGLKKPIFPNTGEVILANSVFERDLFSGTLCHMGQPSVVQIISNCEKRPIGSSGGFGYKSQKPDIDVAIMDSMIYAHWGVTEIKEKKRQKIVC
jgi:phage terminase large subunit-like protein